MPHTPQQIRAIINRRRIRARARAREAAQAAAISVAMDQVSKTSSVAISAAADAHEAREVYDRAMEALVLAHERFEKAYDNRFETETALKVADIAVALATDRCNWVLRQGN